MIHSAPKDCIKLQRVQEGISSGCRNMLRDCLLDVPLRLMYLFLLIHLVHLCPVTKDHLSLALIEFLLARVPLDDMPSNRSHSLCII
jgi:hypothetical protein